MSTRDEFEEDTPTSNFFTTEVDFRDTFNKTAKTPQIGNVIALRETFLSEAPFVNRTNKLFWKKWIESKEYIGMLTAAFSFVQSCITEGGTVNIDKLNDVKNSPTMGEMSTNLADMFFLQKPRDRDIFFNRLPELLCFMIVNSLHATVPKYHRLYNSIKFRELLLDVLNELIGGIRLSDCHKNREWIFSDAHDGQIVTSNTKIFTNEAIKKKAAGGELSSLSSAQSTYTIGQSPLIAAYLGNHSKRADPNGLKLTLFHSPARPLMCLSEDFSLKRVRAKQITRDVMQQTLHSVRSRRAELSKTHDEMKSTFRQDVSHLHVALKTNLAVLENKPVSKRHLLHAAALTGHPAGGGNSGSIGGSIGGSGAGGLNGLGGPSMSSFASSSHNNHNHNNSSNINNNFGSSDDRMSSNNDGVGLLVPSDSGSVFSSSALHSPSSQSNPSHFK